MFTLMIFLSATGIAASLGFGMGMARKKSQLQQSLMRALGLPEHACVTVEGEQWQRILQRTRGH